MISKLVKDSKYSQAFKKCGKVINMMCQFKRHMVNDYVVEKSKFFNSLGMEMLNSGNLKDSQRLFS